MNFPGASIFSSNTYEFSRRPYLVIEHIQFSRRPLCVKHIGIFQEGTLSRTDFVSRSRWLLLMDKKINNILQWYYIDIKAGCC